MKLLTYLWLSFFLLNAVYAGEDENYILRKKILEARKKIEMYNSKEKEIKNGIKEFRETHTKKVERREKDISRIRVEVSKLEKELKNEKLRLKMQRNSLKNYSFQFSVFREKIKNNLKSYNNFVEQGFPYNKESRSANVLRLISDIQFANITPEEIFNRFCNFLNQELLLALDSEIYVEENIKYLRIGRVVMAYSDEEEKDVGILTRKSGKWEWNNNLNFITREAIRNSIKMVEGKKVPKLINFPVPLTLFREKFKVK